MVSSNVLLSHFPLYELFVGEEIYPVTCGFAEEGDPLAFVDPCNTPLTIDLFDGIPRTVVQSIGIRLCL